ncbi:AI-2E family transporter [Limibaculum sp. M0105]|uniref:AI-2E family transporter n=1 Tax=Thermohalobaculum xanthum TaxID=2753746 RepID=A0A8J7M941_9RHOB|nr:AI-2E family transporter [Thermohalobaculum xanthum]MBK0400961.1 AI-2E family transporter [Thermohalobaculum xanthum]
MSNGNQERQRVLRYSVDIFVTLGLISLFAWLSIRLISPFVPILIWALILAVALHPVFVWLRDRLGGRRGMAATALALLGLVLLISPTVLIVDSIIGSTLELADRLGKERLEIPPADPTVRDWPLVGNTVYRLWDGAHADLEKTAEQFAPQIKEFGVFLLGSGAGLARGVIEFALSVIFAAALLSYSEPLGAVSDRLASRIASTRGRLFLETAIATIRNVSRGVIGVAIIQGGLATIGIVAVGIPFAGLVAALTVGAAIIQFPMIAILPTIIYVWSVEATTTALLFTVYMIPVMLCDNVLKPVLMARGLTTPMVVILIGVVGGTLSSGLTGLFIGPVILAMFYEMMKVWIASMDEEAAAAALRDHIDRGAS